MRLFSWLFGIPVFFKFQPQDVLFLEALPFDVKSHPHRHSPQRQLANVAEGWRATMAELPDSICVAGFRKSARCRSTGVTLASITRIRPSRTRSKSISPPRFRIASRASSSTTETTRRRPSRTWRLPTPCRPDGRKTSPTLKQGLSAPS